MPIAPSPFQPALASLEALLDCVDLEEVLEEIIHGSRELASLPALAFRGILLTSGLTLTLFGFALIRPVNFTFGAYLGGVVALSLLGQFTHDPGCVMTVGVTLGGALLLGALFALLRKSMYAVLGAVLGNGAGSFAFAALLGSGDEAWLPLGPEARQDARYFVMGFCSVLGTLVTWHVGEGAWAFGTALLGAYLSVVALLELAVIPYVPNGSLRSFRCLPPVIPGGASRLFQPRSWRPGRDVAVVMFGRRDRPA